MGSEANLSAKSIINRYAMSEITPEAPALTVGHYQEIMMKHPY